MQSAAKHLAWKTSPPPLSKREGSHGGLMELFRPHGRQINMTDFGEEFTQKTVRNYPDGLRAAAAEGYR
jgi:hypothetical protein